MKICIIVEGAYPYITGGVSSWIHQLITNMQEYEFEIISIMPESNKRGKFKYNLPENLVFVHEYFLDEILQEKRKKNRCIKSSKEELEILKDLVLSKEICWKCLFDIFEEEKTGSLTASDIILSKPFYYLIQEAYRENYFHSPFTDVYWTIRSMYALFFSMLLQEYPEADLYHSVSTGYAGLIGAYLSYDKGKPYVLTEHGIYTREREEEIIKANWAIGHLKDIWIDFFYNLSDSAYTLADIVTSLFSKNRDIQVEIGCPIEKTRIIHNGVNIEQFNEVALAVSNRDEDTLNIGAIVRVVSIKDIKTMLEAFSIVNKKLDNINFYIMGPIDEDEEYYQECLMYKEFLKLDNVIFTGVVDVKEYLKKIDLLVLTSISEGQPLAILEGLACKIPFVATNVGDCKGLIMGENDDLGPAGRIVNVMDYVNIADNIIDLCKNNSLRRKYGEIGYKRVKEHYSFDEFIESYKELYENLAVRR